MYAYKATTRQLIYLELLWWFFTAAIVAVVLFPVHRSLSESYPFWAINIVAIAAFVMATRYIFFLRFSPVAYRQELKVILAIACIPAVFTLVSNVNHFQTYLDERGVLSFMSHLHPERLDTLDRYIRAQMIFFGVGSVVSTSVLAVRLIISVWRVRNKGTV